MTNPRSVSLQSLSAFLGRNAVVLALILTLVGTLRIASAYGVFSHTADEPIHIACGLEWLSKGTFTYEEQHPPLTRVMVALGPFLDGARSTGQPDLAVEGLTALRGKGGDHDRRLMLARMGNLPFFWAGCLAVFLIGGKVLEEAGAVVALFIFTMLPVVLAHAGQATTDMGATAFFALSVYCLFTLVEDPGLPRGLCLGGALAGMVLCKFSTLAFFPAAILLTAIAFWRRRREGGVPFLDMLRRAAPALAAATGMAVLLIWAGYLFSFGPAPFVPFNTPFPELFEGIKQVAGHNQEGHLSYLLGTRSLSGFWLYFPVVLAVKTPLAVLAMVVASLALNRKQRRGWPLWTMWAVFLGVFMVAMNSRINIGLRHILPAIPFLSIAAAAGIMTLLEKGERSSIARYSALSCLLLLAVPSVLAHPDYLPFFNIMAGDHPEDIIVDSDLDWGQDMKRLGQRLRELNAPYVVFTPQFVCDLDGLGFPPRQAFNPLQPLPGYNAVGLTPLKLNRLFLPEDQPSLNPWPERAGQYEMVGKGIRLYYIPGGLK